MTEGPEKGPKLLKFSNVVFGTYLALLVLRSPTIGVAFANKGSLRMKIDIKNILYLVLAVVVGLFYYCSADDKIIDSKKLEQRISNEIAEKWGSPPSSVNCSTVELLSRGETGSCFLFHKGKSYKAWVRFNGNETLSWSIDPSDSSSSRY